MNSLFPKNLLLIIAVILITLVVYSAAIYGISYFRKLAIETLLSKEMNKMAGNRSRFLADINNSLQSNGTSTEPIATTTLSEEVAVQEAQKTFEYKMVLDADPCTLNTLGADGWEISQAASGDLDSVRGFDATCRRSGTYGALA